MDDKKIFAKRLSQAMRAKGFTNKDLINDKIDYPHLWNYRQGKYFPRVETLKYLATKLDVTVDWLLCLEMIEEERGTEAMEGIFVDTRREVSK